MTHPPLSFDFPLMTPPIPRGEGKPPLILSHRCPWQVPIADMCVEVAREVSNRRGFYPRQIAAGRMRQADADHHIALLDEIHCDLTGIDRDPALTARWEPKVRELRRELALRRNWYPKGIEQGRLRELDAGPWIEAMEAVHWHYWIRLEHWDEHSHPADTHVRALCPAGIASSVYVEHRNCHGKAAPCPGWAAASVPRAAIRARSAAVEAWLWQAHQAGDPAVADYLTPDQIAWHQAHQQKEAA